jgi:nanoRNase/pAp phosphatase (c-di-AMP/oligoRNAs hydrolase)
MIPKFDNSIVMGHISPDADSLCSSISLTRWLRSNGMSAHCFISENYPSNYQWLIEENKDLIIHGKENRKIKKCKNFYILDCEPTYNRTGFNFDFGKSSVVNIDHHLHRFSNYKDKRYVSILKPSVSTCSILVDYGINYDILFLGIYYDSVAFSISPLEAIRAASKLDIDENRLSYMIESSRYQGTKKNWDALVGLNTWWSHDSSVCFCFDKSPLMDSQQMLYILNKYAKTVVFFHKNKNVSMRTVDSSVELSNIAKILDGGGHAGAAGFKIKNRISLLDILKRIKNNAVEPTANEQISLKNFEIDLYSLLKIN